MDILFVIILIVLLVLGSIYLTKLLTKFARFCVNKIKDFKNKKRKE